MAEVKPFRALRFNTEKAGKIDELVCPPYDVISDEQRQEYLSENEHNIIRLELPKGDNPYETASETLKNWIDSEILKRDDKEAVYIYEEEFTAYGQRKKFKGCIVRVKLEEFSKGVVLPHEETLSKAKEDRFNLMKATNCNFSQIYSLYMDSEHKILNRLDRLSTGKPDVELTDNDNVTHRLWVVTDKDEIDAVCKDFADKKLYIADGHHRYETALNFRNYCRENNIKNASADYVMMMLVDMEHEGLVVFPTHRLVRNLENFNAEKAMNDCKEYFDVSVKDNISEIEQTLRTLYEQDKKAFAFYDGGDKWTLLVLKNLDIIHKLLPEKSAATQGLDVTVLHTLVLEKLFGIDAENMAKQINLTYTKYFDEAINSVKSGKAQCAFILNPTRVTEIRDVAAAGEKMPQKSTYFYPKLITGLVMNDLTV
ncbi:MAG: DUF1015 domain-containing protein [Clostridia bacterium]|nr:DUF1015 domain-containing protein [Clostridia bacterium]